MSDRNIELTRRQLLGGALTLGAASAASGAGTFALFSDTETATGSITAGSLDLSIENTAGDVTNGDGTLSFLNASSVTPGDDGTATVTLKNVGSLDGYLTLRTAELTNAENGYSGGEPEDENGEGELADLLRTTVSLGGTDLCNGGALSSFFLPDDTYSLDRSLAAGESVTFQLDWELPSEVGNEVQGDSVGLELVFGLHQEPTGELLPECTPVDVGDGGNDDGDEETEQTITVGSDSVTTELGETATNSGSLSGFGDGMELSTNYGTVSTDGNGGWNWSLEDGGAFYRAEDGTGTVEITATDGDGNAETVSFDLTVEISELAACGIAPADIADDALAALVEAVNGGNVETVTNPRETNVGGKGVAVFLKTDMERPVDSSVVVACGVNPTSNLRAEHAILHDATVSSTLKVDKSLSVGGDVTVGGSFGPRGNGDLLVRMAAESTLTLEKQSTIDSLVMGPNAVLTVEKGLDCPSTYDLAESARIEGQTTCGVGGEEN